MNADISFWYALWEYTFLQRALATTVVVGLVCGVVGSFVILRGLSLMGDAISHAVLPGVAVSYMLGINLFFGAVTTGLLTAFAITAVQRRTNLKSDAAIGIVFSAMFAIGIILITHAKAAANLNNLLFGNVLAITKADMLLTVIVAAAVLTVVEVFYTRLLITSFDPAVAPTYGASPAAMHVVLMVALTCVTVAALQTVGVVLVVAMLITPAATAYLLTHRMRPMMILAGAIGAASAVAGLYLSYELNLPSGPAIVLVLAAGFVLAYGYSRLRNRPRATSQSRANRQAGEPVRVSGPASRGAGVAEATE